MLYMRTRAGLVFIALGLFGRALGSIGPVANLPIVNKVIAPDGFTRDTVLAGGQFPGPLIVGNKVSRETMRLKPVLALTDAVT